MHKVIHFIEHVTIDTLKLVPFLFIAYLVMEALEHKAGEKTHNVVKKAGRLGPVVGSLAGALPQCGFSAAASNLYAGRIITLGTLISIYLSTSDEMLPIMISAKVPVATILGILGIKVFVGMMAGLLIDVFLSGRGDEHHHIHEMCEEENCHCEKGIFVSALIHTLHITIFILLINFMLELLLDTIGEEMLGQLLLNKPIIGQMIAGLVGLIPNCASSVAITELYLEGALSLGAMMSGLLVNAGIGVLILFRVNKNRKENLKIICLLYIIGVLVGIGLGFLPIQM